MACGDNTRLIHGFMSESDQTKREETNDRCQIDIYIKECILIVLEQEDSDSRDE